MVMVARYSGDTVLGRGPGTLNSIGGRNRPDIRLQYPVLAPVRLQKKLPVFCRFFAGFYF